MFCQASLVLVEVVQVLNEIHHESHFLGVKLILFYILSLDSCTQLRTTLCKTLLH